MNYARFIFLFVTLFFVQGMSVSAQPAQPGGQYRCDIITTPAEYSRCCTGTESARVNQILCADYLADQQIRNGGVGQPTPPNTNPTTPSTTGTNGGVIGSSPQTSSRELATCSMKFDSLLDILIWARCVINVAIIPLLFTIAFLVFLWGVISFMRDSANEKKREESKRFMLWGILALTVMVSVWGIVRIVTSTFGLGNTVPQLQTDCLKKGAGNTCR